MGHGFKRCEALPDWQSYFGRNIHYYFSSQLLVSGGFKREIC